MIGYCAAARILFVVWDNWELLAQGLIAFTIKLKPDITISFHLFGHCTYKQIQIQNKTFILIAKLT